MGLHSTVTIAMTKELKKSLLQEIADRREDHLFSASLLTFILWSYAELQHSGNLVCFFIEEVKWYSIDEVDECAHFNFVESFLRNSDPACYKFRRKGEDEDDYEAWGDLDDSEFSVFINKLKAHRYDATV